MRLPFLLILAPLALPVVDLIRRPAGFAALGEASRILPLVGNTLALAAGAVMVAVPLGALAALLVERGGVRGSSLLRAVLLCAAFVPLAVWAASWQAAFGSGLLADAGGWRPWRQGLLPAIWVHATAGVPWVAGFVALALRTTDPLLEDDVRLNRGPRAVWWLVLWPRVKLGAAAGACWVAVQAFTEAAVTDMMMVRTFAEEVYFQLVGNPDGVPAAVAVTLPAWAFAALAAMWLCRRAKRVPVHDGGDATLLFRIGRGATVIVWIGVTALLAVPITGLVAKVGSVPQFVLVVRAHGVTLIESMLWSAVAGAAAAAVVVGACWRARDSSGGWLLALAAVAWLTPAPLAGLGLKQAIDLLLTAEDAIIGVSLEFPPLRSALYDQPSPLPGAWADVVRFFPVAVAVVWPVARRIPQAQRDAARLDGGEFAGVFWPSVRRAAVWAAVAVTVLSLGEVVASKLVQPPGRQTFAQDLFAAMHYGADATVAAMCLLQIAACAMLAVALYWANPERQRRGVGRV